MTWTVLQMTSCCTSLSKTTQTLGTSSMTGITTYTLNVFFHRIMLLFVAIVIFTMAASVTLPSVSLLLLLAGLGCIILNLYI